MTSTESSRPRTALTRGLIALVVVAAVVAAAVVGVRAWWNSSANPIVAGCTAGSWQIDTGQAAVASSLVAVVVTRQLPPRASTLLLAAALQESKLRNIPSGQGDRDSVGVLQQRPSQGWGTVAQLSDPSYAAGAFLDRLVKVPNWQTVPAAEAIQAVQISANGSAYAAHEPQAQALADALDGASPTGLTCRYPAPTKVAPVTTVASQLVAALPVSPPQASGQTLTVPGAGSTTAAWLVANGDRLGIEAVTIPGKRWTRTAGWADGQTPTGGVSATMAAAATR